MDPYAWMDSMSAPGAAGWSAAFVLALAALGISALIVAVVRARGRRARPSGLLLAGILYAAANVGVFATTLALDRFAIFELAYVLTVVLGAPAVVVVAATVVAGREAGRLAVVGFAAWIASVASAHLWIIAQASASV
jgi:hypothetical protein